MTENRRNAIVSMATYTAHKLRNPLFSDMVLRKISLYHNSDANRYLIEYEHISPTGGKKEFVSKSIGLYNQSEYHLFEDTIRELFPPAQFIESELASIFLYLV